ncbi:hypothetical protein SAY87_029180 [Trapa incisa]|uniref:MBTPS1 fourth domain-containing protein n=1 Tax=Trapa incisa TaxID=236973 RepID=A0AAN7KW44_9MYRT|nr:hypothetical protein SAY87_029180 [Trapa incisa]
MEITQKTEVRMKIGGVRFTQMETNWGEDSSCPKRGSKRLPKSMRILWDQFHSIKYTPGSIPRDRLSGHSKGCSPLTRDITLKPLVHLLPALMKVDP